MIVIAFISAFIYLLLILYLVSLWRLFHVSKYTLIYKRVLINTAAFSLVWLLLLTFLFGVGNLVSLGLSTSSQQYNFINIITFIPMFPLQIGFNVHQLYEDIGLGASTWVIIVGSILSTFSILLITASIELAIHKIVVKKKHSSKKL